MQYKSPAWYGLQHDSAAPLPPFPYHTGVQLETMPLNTSGVNFKRILWTYWSHPSFMVWLVKTWNNLNFILFFGRYTVRNKDFFIVSFPGAEPVTRHTTWAGTASGSPWPPSTPQQRSSCSRTPHQTSMQVFIYLGRVADLYPYPNEQIYSWKNVGKFFWQKILIYIFFYF